MAKNKKNYDVSVVNLSHYNIPHIIEDDRKNWISFGEDNLYPQYLIELFVGSGIHSAIVKGVSSMIAGDQDGTLQGIDVAEKEKFNESQKEQYLQLTKLLTDSNHNTIKHLSFDLKLFGACYINVIWNKARTRIAEIKHIPAQYIRVGKCDAFGKINEYYYCYDWNDTRKHPPQTIKAFDEKNRTDASQVYCIKEYNPQSFYYGLPDYIGGADYIRLDMSVAEFHLANLDNGFFPSAMINFSNGVPTEEERREIERKINSKFVSGGNAGKIIMTFNDGKDHTPEVVPLTPNDNDDSYQFLSTEVSRKVLTSHRVTSPLLFGVKGDGTGFGNNADELRDSYSLFNNTVISVFQNTLIDGLKELFKVNKITLPIYIKTLKPADFLDLDSLKVMDEEDQEKEGVEQTMSEKTEQLRKIVNQHDKKNLSKHIEINDENEKVCLAYFDEIGIEVNDHMWFEAHSEKAEPDTIPKYHEFAYAPAGKPNAITRASDIGMFRLLYRYVGPISHNSRSFCQKMVAKSESGTLYTVEDLKKASSRAVNKGFGPKGTNKYDIFLYKGGVNCKHYWERVWYFRKQVPEGYTYVDDEGNTYEGGEFLPNGTLNRFKEVSQSFANSMGVTPKVDDSYARKVGDYRLK